MIVLDTHAWVWLLVAPKRISKAAREAIEQAPRLGVSTISAWEVATLNRRGRIDLDCDAGQWVAEAFAAPRIEALPPSPQAAAAAGLLDDRAFPNDPADRLIYATARTLGATLITRDAAIRAYDPAATLW